MGKSNEISGNKTCKGVYYIYLPVFIFSNFLFFYPLLCQKSPLSHHITIDTPAFEFSPQELVKVSTLRAAGTIKHILFDSI